jgi:hypothetical protein
MAIWFCYIRGLEMLLDIGVIVSDLERFLMHRRIGARVALYKDHNTIIVYIYF